MKNQIIKKNLFTSLLINENGIVKKENREWVEIAGCVLFCLGFMALLLATLMV